METNLGSEILNNNDAGFLPMCSERLSSLFYLKFTLFTCDIFNDLLFLARGEVLR
jgi:hypothetical protein